MNLCCDVTGCMLVLHFDLQLGKHINPSATLQVRPRHAASEMTGSTTDFAGLEPICASDMNWHNVISQSVEVKCLFSGCKLQWKAGRWRLSLFVSQGEYKHCLSCFLDSKLRSYKT